MENNMMVSKTYETETVFNINCHRLHFCIFAKKVNVKSETKAEGGNGEVNGEAYCSFSKWRT